jgi:thiol-disulfide isomerase/thioredoxin
LIAVSARAFIAFLAVTAVVGLLAYGLLSKGSAGVDILVNFWASWCGPCRDESPALQRFQNRYGGPRFTVLGVDTRDLSGDGTSFVREFGLTYPELRDGDGDAAHDYGTTGVPENFLVDPSGKLRLAQHGPVTAAYLTDYVAPLIAAHGKAKE